MQFEIKAEKRQLQGTSASRRLRRAGRVPGIVYGGAVAPQSIDIDHNELYLAMRKEAFHSSVINLNLAGEIGMCLLRDVQLHPYKPIIKHVDFQRIDASHIIHQKVPLHFINAEQSPGVKLDKAMVQQVMTEIDVRCLPKDLPEFIEVDLKEMHGGQTLHASDLTFPIGVEAVLHGDENPLVVTMVVRGGGGGDEGDAQVGEDAAAEGDEKK